MTVRLYLLNHFVRRKPVIALTWWLLVLVLVCNTSCSENTRLNHIQVLGSHNSYKLPIEPHLLELLYSLDSTRFKTLDYAHVSISRQLDLGIRKLELDVYYDPVGGRYAHPYGIHLLDSLNLPPLPYDESQKMHSPGFKVLHIQDIDFRSSCYILSDCLMEILSWSESNRGHLPVVISFNTKSEVFPEQPSFAVPLPFTEAAFDSLESEVLSVIERKRIIAPDDVRGRRATLREAVLLDGWPSLAKSRNKFVFILDEPIEKIAPYIKDHPSLTDRLMFVNASAESDEAALFIINDPIGQQQKIRTLVRQGFMVRTRADADTEEARNGNLNRFEAALKSGAHFISTDYYLPDAKFGKSYHIALPEGAVFRLNPVTRSQ